MKSKLHGPSDLECQDSARSPNFWILILTPWHRPPWRRPGPLHPGLLASMWCSTASTWWSRRRPSCMCIMDITWSEATEGWSLRFYRRLHDINKSRDIFVGIIRVLVCHTWWNTPPTLFHTPHPHTNKQPVLLKQWMKGLLQWSCRHNFLPWWVHYFRRADAVGPLQDFM